MRQQLLTPPSAGSGGWVWRRSRPTRTLRRAGGRVEGGREAVVLAVGCMAPARLPSWLLCLISSKSSSSSSSRAGRGCDASLRCFCGGRIRCSVLLSAYA